MSKVTLVVAKWCPICPRAKKIWEELRVQHEFEYEEIDANSEKGKELVAKHSIMSVPTTIIDDKVAFAGVPDKNEAIKLLK